ncbi:mechanosensitive ion channel [Funiculus sociatus GB2-A5]|uniref:Mechanosensitive ion channel n=1 Tax=Funiculus sociatus GB2-A5 TaxID=2933946 RepID=A0ABV0JHH8_9CYAN|nr:MULTISPECIES: mechanosensitive ion channel family protein [unclassified Trichocoleus]MBD1908830.1 mechanosensitive ion channel family protein [Trichocoleus sp. FACHB-832]MBD2064321.1 mechanosensitive ion channel family protein [Trichocoleus sp. FACHB-6]
MKNLFHRSTRNKIHRFQILIVITGVLFTATPAGTQEMPTSKPTPVRVYGEELYFADVTVRGYPVFQVGSLAGLSAKERSQIINRRIASVLAQPEALGQVAVKPDDPKKIATLQVNNRVLMTVTQQDARDFSLPVEVLAQRWARQLNRALEKPSLAIDVGQRLYITVRDLLRDTISKLPSILGALVVIGITWGFAKGMRYVTLKWAQKTEGDRSAEILLGRVGYGGVWVIGSVVALGVLGLNFGALLGAVGLTSVAIGFGLKEIFSNYISGMILLAGRPFRLGDQVVIKEFEGTITQIQLRATTLNTYDGRKVYIPNQEVFQASITNNTAYSYRRSSVTVGITYKADINTATQVITDAVVQVEGVQSNPPPEVLVRELAAGNVGMEIRFWVNSRRLEFLKTTSSANQAIKEALHKAGIEIPTEIYTVLVRNSQNDAAGDRDSQRLFPNGNPIR